MKKPQLSHDLRNIHDDDIELMDQYLILMRSTESEKKLPGGFIDLSIYEVDLGIDGYTQGEIWRKLRNSGATEMRGTDARNIRNQKLNDLGERLDSFEEEKKRQQKRGLPTDPKDNTIKGVLIGSGLAFLIQFIFWILNNYVLK